MLWFYFLKCINLFKESYGLALLIVGKANTPFFDTSILTK